MYTVKYWPNWAGGEPRQFSRETLGETRRKLVYWLSFDSGMPVLIQRDGVRLSCVALIEGREEAWDNG